MTVSVVLPTYERADVVGGAVESVRAQTHEDWELVVVDGGSDGAAADARRDVSGDVARRLERLGYREDTPCETGTPAVSTISS